MKRSFFSCWILGIAFLGGSFGLFGCVTGAEYTRMERALGMEIIELRQRREDGEKRLVAFQNDIGKYKQETEAARQAAEALKKQIQAEKDLQAELKKKIEELEKGQGASRGELQKCGEMLQGRGKKLFEMQSELDKKEAAIRQKEEEIAKKQKEAEDLKKALATREAEISKKEELLKASLGRVEELEKQVNSLRKIYSELTDRLKSIVQAGRLKIEMRRGMLVLQMPEKILFATGSSTVKREGVRTIKEIAEILKGMQYRWQVVGHTDSVGSPKSNWSLSVRRASSVLFSMLEGGMAPEQVSIAGFGQYQPAAPNDTKENKSLNRRTEIVLIPDLSEMFKNIQLPTAPSPRE